MMSDTISYLKEFPVIQGLKQQQLASKLPVFSVPWQPKFIQWIGICQTMERKVMSGKKKTLTEKWKQVIS